MYQLGLVFQTGKETLCVKASVEIDTCDIAIKAAYLQGRLLQNRLQTALFL